MGQYSAGLECNHLSPRSVFGSHPRREEWVQRWRDYMRQRELAELNRLRGKKGNMNRQASGFEWSNRP